MTDENGNRIVIAIIAICLFSTLCYCAKITKEKTFKYIENGYTQKTLPGSDCAKWVKE